LPMLESVEESRRKPRSVSRQCKSIKAATVTRGVPRTIPAQADGSSIQVGTAITSPGAIST
jgi:hypothetical protein